MRYASFLRGINVGAGPQVKMEALKEICTRLGLKDAQTLINSGNVVFEAPGQDVSALEATISAELKKQLQMDITVLVLSKPMLADLVESCPFADSEAAYATLLQNTAAREITADLDQAKLPEDRYLVLKNVVWLDIPGGYGRTKLNNSFIEKKSGVKATTRNLRTLKKVLEML